MLHASCGAENGAVKEEEKSDGSISFVGFCKNHMAQCTLKRLSSDNLNQALNMKYSMQLKHSASRKNSDWLRNKMRVSESGNDDHECSFNNESSDASTSISSVSYVFEPPDTAKAPIDNPTDGGIQKNARISLAPSVCVSPTFVNAPIDNETDDDIGGNASDSLASAVHASTSIVNTPMNNETGETNTNQSIANAEHVCFKDQILDEVSTKDIACAFLFPLT